MDFIDGNRLAARIHACPMGAVGLVAPVMGKSRGGERGGLGPDFAVESEGIAFQRQQRALGADDLEFVGAVIGDIGNEDFPHPNILAMPHLVAAAIPVIEISHHRHALSIGSPDREMYALGATEY